MANEEKKKAATLFISDSFNGNQIQIEIRYKHKHSYAITQQ